ASLGGPPHSYVEAGVFSSRAQAERRRHELNGLGPVAVKRLNSGPKPIFRVQLGPFDEVEAAAVIAQIADLGIADRVHILE
ncbi:MAG: SPOR domain-containing protein, partial [Hyphomicrobium sp.]